MKNQTLINNLNNIVEVDNTWQDDVIFYEKNKAWLENSAKIAVKVLSTLRLNRNENIYPGSQKDLAELLNISPQQVNKIVKGTENLTLETISRLEKALNIQLIAIYQIHTKLAL